jgi:HPt (histidine-containing phosphotransfer) domain-containing protein
MSKINLEYLNELSGGDADFVASMLRTYIEETGRDIEALKEAFYHSDFNGITFWAHKIKASFRMLGLDSLADKTELLEKKTEQGSYHLSEIEEIFLFVVENAAPTFKQAERLVGDV